MYRRNSQATVFNSSDEGLTNGGNLASAGNNGHEPEMMDIKQEPSGVGNDQDLNSDSHVGGGRLDEVAGSTLSAAQLQREHQLRKAGSNPNGVGTNGGDPYEFSEDGKNGSKQVRKQLFCGFLLSIFILGPKKILFSIFR